MCGPKFCSMEITRQVREEAAKQGIDAESARQQGLQSKSAEFRAAGSKLYVEETPVSSGGSAEPA